MTKRDEHHEPDADAGYPEAEGPNFDDTKIAALQPPDLNFLAAEVALASRRLAGAEVTAGVLQELLQHALFDLDAARHAKRFAIDRLNVAVGERSGG